MDWASPAWGDHLRLWSISQPSWSQSPSGYPTDTLYFLRAGQDSHRGVVLVKKYDILLGRTKRDGAPKRVGCHSLCQAVFGACCRNLAYGRPHTPGKGCVGAKGQSWFSRALQKLGLGLVSTWQPWIMPAFLVYVAMGSQVSCCFVTGLLCDLFLKWKLFLGCSKLSEASALCLY